jgi:acetyltransferase-like isoleucine patch superfamily enzyme
VETRAVATKDVDDWTIVAGNPARPLKKRVLDTP